MKTCYLDHAATSFPKPNTVIEKSDQTMRYFCANPGRSGHVAARQADRIVAQCREAAAQLFGLDDPSRVIFTWNATSALNIVIHGLLKPGDHVITSCLEHNAVARPCNTLCKQGVAWDEAMVYPGEPAKTVSSFEALIRPETRLICVTQVSNVFGIVLPVRELCAMAHRHGVPVCVDASQGAGAIPLNMKEDGIDYLCMPGHKGLLGPQGTGLLLIGNDFLPAPLMQGGTGSASCELDQPMTLPDRFESGTLNVPGLAGLTAGIEWVMDHGVEQIGQEEAELSGELRRLLQEIPGVTVYEFAGPMAGVFSFNVNGYTPAEVGKRLDQLGFAVRPGLHCAPLAHIFAGTMPEGTVRASVGWNTKRRDILRFCDAVWNVGNEKTE